MNVDCSIGLHFSSRTSINVDHSGNLIAPECHEFMEFGSCKHESLHLLIFWHVLMGTTYINLAPVTSRQFFMTKPQVVQARNLPWCRGGSKHAAIKTQQSNYSVVHLLNAFNQLNSPGTGQIVGLASSHQSVLFIQFWSVLHLWLEGTAHDALLRWSSCFCSHPEHRLGLQPLPGMLPKAAVSKDMQCCLAAY